MTQNTAQVERLTITRADFDAILAVLSRAEAYSRFGKDGVAAGTLSFAREWLPMVCKPICRTEGCGSPVFGDEGWCASCGYRSGEDDTEEEERDAIEAQRMIDAELRVAQGWD